MRERKGDDRGRGRELRDRDGEVYGTEIKDVEEKRVTICGEERNKLCSVSGK